MIVGPNTGLGHNSMVLLIDSQVEYILGALDAMKQDRADAIEDSNDLEQMEQRYADLTVPVDVLFGRDDIVLNWMRHGDALRHPYFRTVEAYGDDGELFEKIVIESITPKSFDAEPFDPKNPDYKF